MSKVEFARDKLRTRFSKLMDEYEAMILFLARMDQGSVLAAKSPTEPRF